MNDVLTLLGIDAWRPLLAALVLPPLPFFVLLLVGARLILPRRGLGWLVILFSLTGLWLSACLGTGRLLHQHALRPPLPLASSDIAALKAAVAAKEPVAIVVLGGGMETVAPEYGVSNLSAASLERLRYAVWLSRETGVPVGFSGGTDWGQPEGNAQAQTAARIASKEFNQPLAWVEDRSRDTRENAEQMVPMLKKAGIQRIVLVTHGYHMPRALGHFERVAAGSVKIQPAPMGLAPPQVGPGLTWMPTSMGHSAVTRALRELLGRLVGA